MPVFSPANLRSKRLHFLFDLEWGGAVFRLSEQVVQPTLNGTALEYTDGLEFDGTWEDKLDLFTPSPASRSVSLTLHLAEVVDVPVRVGNGYPLGAATGTLSLWLEGDTTATVLVRGGLRGVRHGTKDDPVQATLEELPLRALGLVPGTAQRIGPPSEHDDGGIFGLDLSGNYYPVIFGRPGGQNGYGSPSFYFNVGVSTGFAAIAAHDCVPGTVKLTDYEDDASDTVTVRTEFDILSGARRTAVTTSLSGTNPHAEAKHPTYVRWTAGNAAGLPSKRDPSVPMRGAGEILLWLLERSGARFDPGKMEALIPLLSGFRLDGAIIPGRDERVSPMDWITSHLLPVLPISARLGPDGLYYVLWKWGANGSDVVAKFNADEEQASRVGLIEYSDPDDLYQEVRLDYAYDYAGDKYQSTLTYTGNRAATDKDSTAHLDLNLQGGFLRYSGGDPSKVITLEMSTQVVLDTATAHLVCQYLARRHGVQTREISYEVDPEYAWLEPGDVVQITDKELALTNRIAIVEKVIWSSSEQIGLGLRILGI